MEDNNEMNNDIQELVDRAEEDINNSEEIGIDESNDNNTLVDNKFNGYFHERDSLAENNIVDEVKTSFLEYSMSVILHVHYLI